MRPETYLGPGLERRHFESRKFYHRVFIPNPTTRRSFSLALNEQKNIYDRPWVPKNSIVWQYWYTETDSLSTLNCNCTQLMRYLPREKNITYNMVFINNSKLSVQICFINNFRKDRKGKTANRNVPTGRKNLNAPRPRFARTADRRTYRPRLS